MSIIRPNQPEPSPGVRPKKLPTGNYTQVNILFPSEQVELPSADNFKAFPPEAQKAILASFDREQIQRHAWMQRQQDNDHAFNMQSARHFFIWKMTGTIAGTLISLTGLVTGGLLVAHGASIAGMALMLGAVAGLVGVAIYGHKAMQPTAEKPQGENSTISEDSKQPTT